MTDSCRNSDSDRSTSNCGMDKNIKKDIKDIANTTKIVMPDQEHDQCRNYVVNHFKQLLLQLPLTKPLDCPICNATSLLSRIERCHRVENLSATWIAPYFIGNIRVSCDWRLHVKEATNTHLIAAKTFDLRTGGGCPQGLNKQWPPSRCTARLSNSQLSRIS